MSEVYIRSQNKEKLYRLGGNYACVEYGEYEDIKKKRGGAEADKKRHVICISDGCLEEIGEYATKERCLEVLDEIQKACVSYLFTAGGAAVIRGGMDVQPAVCSSNTEAVRNAREVGEADSDSKGIYRHAGEFRPPAHYRGQSRGLRRVSGSVQTVCRP